MADFNQVQTLAPDEPKVYYYRGLAYQKTGDSEKAIADLEHFLTLHGESWAQEGARCHLQELYAGKPFNSLCSGSGKGG